MAFVLGILAALASPLTMTVGLIFLENHWKGSAYALTMLECNMVSVGFFAAALIEAARARDDSTNRGSLTLFFGDSVFTLEPVLFLLLSSFLGIIVGDITWFNALRLLGAQRVMIMESIKPFVAAFFGYIILDEALRLAAIGGIAMTVLGILLVSLENKEDQSNDATEVLESQEVERTNNSKHASEIAEEVDTEKAPVDQASEACPVGQKSGHAPENDRILESPVPPTISGSPQAIGTSEIQSTAAALRKGRTRRELQIGYAMAITNAALDTYGAVLTKEYGQGMTVWEINLIRFGFAGVFMSICSLLLMCRDYCFQSKHPRTTSAPDNPGRDEQTTPTAEEGSAKERNLWYKLPPFNSMTKPAWLLVSVGVAFATFFTPALITYALFQIALALTTTLGSVGPLYALPLTYVMQKHQQRPTIKAWLGAILAVAGIVVLSFWGTLDEDE